jgi:quinol monooxygenase YgiN
MYASIRRYNTGSVTEATRNARKHFAHAIRQAPGLVAYYIVESAAGEWTTVSIFENRQAAERSDRLAADYIFREGVGELMGEPQVTGGEVTFQVP